MVHSPTPPAQPPYRDERRYLMLHDVEPACRGDARARRAARCRAEHRRAGIATSFSGGRRSTIQLSARASSARSTTRRQS